jgi:hypothetical protein
MICKNGAGHYVHAKCEGKSEIDAMKQCIKCLQEIADKNFKQGTWGEREGIMHISCYNKKRKLSDTTVY